jgi:hypothetical protein
MHHMLARICQIIRLADTPGKVINAPCLGKRQRQGA